MSGIALNIDAKDLQILRDRVTKLHGEADGENVRRVMGFAIKEVIQKYFAKIAQDSQHHVTSQSLGAERTGFYELAMQGTHDPQLEAGGVSVSIEKEGIAQRY